MVKSIVTVIIALFLIFGGAVFEAKFVNKQFNEFDVALSSLYDKTKDQTANKQDVLAVQENWHAKKRVLHIFIPHNEIKEIDLWLGETISLINFEKYDDALSKLDVLIELCREIPKTFTPAMPNIL